MKKNFAVFVFEDRDKMDLVGENWIKLLIILEKRAILILRMIEKPCEEKIL